MASNILPSSGSLKFSHYTKTSFILHKISEQKVQTLISKLDEKKAIRHGDIPTKFFKLSNSVVTPFLTHIFNRCMTEGIYPNYLKEAQIVPLRKSGDSTICSNYRLISLLPYFNKIFEKLLHDRLYCYLKDFGLLSEHQYGFRPNSSTALAVEDIYSNLLANHNKGVQTCSLFIDCLKAFDTVDHEILLKKMEMNFGIRGIPLMLMKSYLSNRSQFTFVQNMASKIVKITCGIPQGSTLDPCTFIRNHCALSIEMHFQSKSFYALSIEIIASAESLSSIIVDR